MIITVIIVLVILFAFTGRSPFWRWMATRTLWQLFLMVVGLTSVAMVCIKMAGF